MLPWRVGSRPRERSSIVRRRKRAKTFHTVEDEVFEAFRDIHDMVGHNRSSDIVRSPIAQYDGGIEERSLVGIDRTSPLEDALPEANLKSVPNDPSLQALWIAREIKRLVEYNERHNNRTRGALMSNSTPESSTFNAGPANRLHGDPEETPESSFQSSRSVGRQRRQSGNLKNPRVVDRDVDRGSRVMRGAQHDPLEGVRLLSTLVNDGRVQHTLLNSTSLGPGNFAKRCSFGTQFLQSMAADTIPPDPSPAAKLKHSLWRSRNHMPYFAALHILAGFSEIVEAIDVAFQGRLDYSTPLTRRQPPLYDHALPTESMPLVHGAHIRGAVDDHHLNGHSTFESLPNTTSMRPIHRRPRHAEVPLQPRPVYYPEIAPKTPAIANDSHRVHHESFPNPASRESHRDESIAGEVTAPMRYTQIDVNQTCKAIAALKGAVAILDEMSYGALKYSFMPQSTGSLAGQYHTPYGPPGSNTFPTPYTNSSPIQVQSLVAGSVPLQQPLSGPPFLQPIAAPNGHNMEAPYVGDRMYSSGGHSTGQQISKRKGKGKGKALNSNPVPKYVFKPSGGANEVAEAPTRTTDAPRQDDEDQDDENAQIDSFLALAAGGDSDSDDESDRDKTISREMTPCTQFLLDDAAESIVRGIANELATNRNWGHGLAFLPPPTHLYQMENAHRFIEGLTRSFDDARVSVNCVLSAEHSHAQEAFYRAIIRRVSDPYVEGTLPQYSDVVYHNGQQYRAVPSRDHPMYQQQLSLPPGPPPPPPPAWPPPPPPSSQVMRPFGSHMSMAPPFDPINHALAPRPTLGEQSPGAFGQLVSLRPAPPAGIQQLPPRQTLGNLNSTDPYIRDPGLPHPYANLGNDRISRRVTHPIARTKRKRVIK